MNKPIFSKILNKHKTHSTLIDEQAVISAMEECYELGLKQSEGQKELLENAFKSLLHEYFYTGKPNKSKNLFIEEWEKKAGIY
jgi:hypothetical protein